MLVFIIPIKSPKVAKSWSTFCQLFDRCLRSVCNQTSPEFHVIAVCNEKPEIKFQHPQVTYVEVDFPIPQADYNSKNDDKSKKITVGLAAARALNPTHIMVVDADDCISRRIAAFVRQAPQAYGWYVDRGYEYEDGRTAIAEKPEFYKVCGTCNIIRYDLLDVPEIVPEFEEIGFDRFLTGHAFAKPILAERGTPLEALPFPGTIYIRDRVGESISLQEPWLEKLKRNPKETLRIVKKQVLAPFQQRPLTDAIREEFGLNLSQAVIGQSLQGVS